MADYIDREQAIESVCKDITDYGIAYDVKEALKKIPSADVRENVRGEWIELYKDNYKCSVCGSWWTITEGTPQDNGIDYCPNCGADMRGEE